MSLYQSQVKDEFGRYVKGAKVYVYSSEGAAEAVTTAGGVPIAQPIITGPFGDFEFDAADGHKIVEIWFNGAKRWRELIQVGPLETRTIRNGNGAPAPALGSDGDYYIDNVAAAIYGPKTAGAWGAGKSLGGPPGDDAPSPNFSFSVSTLAAGSNATLDVGGAYPNISLAFGVPRGTAGAPGAGATDDTAFGPSWDGVTGASPSQNAVYDKFMSLTKANVGLGNVDNTADAAKAVLTATKLATPRTINGVAFDGSANITINAVDATARVASSLVGAANGLATLDATGTLASAQIPAALLGAVRFQTTWNASTNSPAIPAASAANKGYYYIVTTAGTTAIDGINDWALGDWIISDGTVWRKVDNTDAVVSVAGLVGVITAASLKTALGLVVADVSGAAPLASPALTGNPTAPTQAAGDASTKLATTAFVNTIGKQTVASGATVTPTFTNDAVTITAQAVALTLANWSGTAQDMWALVVRIKDNGTSQTIAYGANYLPVDGLTLPASTTVGKTLELTFVHNSVTGKHVCLSAVTY